MIPATECNTPNMRFMKLTEESKNHSSLTRQDLNQKSYMSENFGIGLLPKGSSIENYDNQRGDLIRGVPKFIQSNKGLRYATE